MSKFATPSAELRAVLKRLRRQHIARVYSIESWPAWCGQPLNRFEEHDDLYRARADRAWEVYDAIYRPPEPSWFTGKDCCLPYGSFPRCVGCPSTPGEERRMTHICQDQP